MSNRLIAAVLLVLLAFTVPGKAQQPPGTLDVITDGAAVGGGDQMPNGRDFFHFGEETKAGATADPDSNGFDNLAESITGPDPANGSSYFKAASGFTVCGTPLRTVWTVAIRDR